MKLPNFNIFWTILVLLCSFALTTELFAQEDKPAKRPTAREMQAESLNSLSREEKNTMMRCPLHNKHMRLSDNYRADASDFRVSEGYPFAEQLNYRRACSACTKALNKEEKRLAKEEAQNNGGGTFERCEVHNSQLLVNGDFSSVDQEANPDLIEAPHAKQHRFKTYCKTCTKVVKIRNK